MTPISTNSPITITIPQYKATNKELAIAIPEIKPIDMGKVKDLMEKQAFQLLYNLFGDKYYI